MQKHVVGTMSLVMMTLCLVAFETPMAGQAPVDANATEHDLILLGTVLHDAGKPMAIIQVGKAGEQDLYRIGDVVAGGRLTKIQHDRVTLAFAETEVELGLSGVTGGAATTVTERVQPPLIQTDDGFWRVERETLDQLSSEPELMTQVTSLGDEGVRVDKVQPDDLFHKLGLRQGDVILRINGRVPGAGLSMKQAIAKPMIGNETMLRLEIERQGSMDLLYYAMDP